mmetsp:Transcript_2086/g.5367  ORF Transcript_2086/g.5367 Transcript_2086/m.5367 type:complete len:377 (-) Transcript_2086:146-1276(-)
MLSSNDVALQNALATRDSIKTEACQVDGAIARVEEVLGNSAACGDRHLQTVATESSGKKEVFDLGVGADHGVVVERVKVIAASPRAGDLELGKGRDAVREHGPHLVLEKLVGRAALELGREVVRGHSRVDSDVLVFRGADPADELARARAALAAKVDAARVHRERAEHAARALHGARVDGEDVAQARLDGQSHAGQLGELAAPGAGGVDQGAALDLLAALERDRGDLAALRVHLDAVDAAGHEGDAELGGLATRVHEQGVGVKPAFVGRAERGEANVVAVEEREALGEGVGLQQSHVGALGELQLVVLAQHLSALLSAGHEQVALLGKADSLGPVALVLVRADGGQLGVVVLDESQRGHAESDVLEQAKLLAETAA